MGTILAVRTGVHRLVEIKTDEGGALDLQLDDRTFDTLPSDFIAVGQRVLIAIDADRIHLLPRCSRPLQFDNEWLGRVVLVEHDLSLVTVKIRGQQVTLKSANVGPSTERGWCAWDQAIVSIAPDAVRILPIGSSARLRRRLLTEYEVPPLVPSLAYLISAVSSREHNSVLPIFFYISKTNLFSPADWCIPDFPFVYVRNRGEADASPSCPETLESHAQPR